MEVVSTPELPWRFHPGLSAQQSDSNKGNDETLEAKPAGSRNLRWIRK